MWPITSSVYKGGVLLMPGTSCYLVLVRPDHASQPLISFSIRAVRGHWVRWSGGDLLILLVIAFYASMDWAVSSIVLLGLLFHAKVYAGMHLVLGGISCVRRRSIAEDGLSIGRAVECLGVDGTLLPKV